jgi:hypothetical protein
MPKIEKKIIFDYFYNLSQERGHTILQMDLKTKKTTKLTLQCNKCKTIFEKTGQNYSRIKEGKKTEHNLIVDENGNKTHFHPLGCPGCFSLFIRKHVKRFSGEEHPLWKGGLSEGTRHGYKRSEYEIWRQLQFQSYKGTCFLTGNKNREQLVVHHLDSFAAFPEKRYDLDNGVVIDKSVHMLFHQLYGSKTTREDFEHFALMYYKKKSFPWRSCPLNEIQQNALKESIVAKRDQKHNQMMSLIEDRGYLYVSSTYENRHSTFEIYCPKHKKTHKTTPRLFTRAMFGVPCCRIEYSAKHTPPLSQKGKVRSAETLEKKKKTLRNKFQMKVLNYAQQRNHTVVEGQYENQFSVFKINCNFHQKAYAITCGNYSKKIYHAVEKFQIALLIDNNFLIMLNSNF